MCTRVLPHFIRGPVLICRNAYVYIYIYMYIYIYVHTPKCRHVMQIDNPNVGRHIATVLLGA